MKIHDISLAISAASVVWPNHPKVKIDRIRDLSKGDNSTVSTIEMTVHTGTHVDAPAHFLQNGATTDAIPLKDLIGKVNVVDAKGHKSLNAELLEALPIPSDCSRIIFHTDNSRRWSKGEKNFHHEYTGITPSGARWLVNHGIRLVGVDYLSVSPYKESAPTHNIFLKAGVVCLEGLCLDGIDPGKYELVCLPLKLEGVEGAPARAILIERNR